jgi:Fe-coproporphyrin III synthase
MNKANIKEVVLAITYRCNSRCKMCNIWQLTEYSGEFKPEDLTFLTDATKDINITGGEPFLRKELADIVKILDKINPNMNIIISSNGFATDLILEKTKHILKIKPLIGIAISIDGVGEVHDKIRGMEGGYNKAIATLKGLKKIGVKNLKLAFTLADYNAEELKKIYRLSRSLGVEMTLAAVHSSDNYFNKENFIISTKKIAEQLDWLIDKELSGLDPKRWARAYFTYGLKQYLATGDRILPDYSGMNNIFIDPQGNVYPNDISTKKIGNIKEPENIILIQDQKENDSFKSWMICTARPSIKKHKFKVVAWIIANKIKVHARHMASFSANWFFYFLGLSIAILNRLRHILLDYRTPRPIPLNQIEKNIEYVFSVVNNFEKQLNNAFENNYNFEQKNILEIGPGQDLGTGIIYMSKGAKSYTAIDRFKLLVSNPMFYQKILNRVDKSQSDLKNLVDIISAATADKNNKEIRLNNFKYLNVYSEKMSEKINDKFDLIVSQAVLEHVDDPEKAFREMYMLLDDRGVICHEIDFKSHTSIIRDIDPLNFLRFGKTLYRLIKFKGSPNRLRIDNYIKIAKNAGFKNIKIEILNSLDEDEIDKQKKYFAPPFKRQKSEDLRILSAVLIANKLT